MGCGVAVMSLIGLLNTRWLIEQTRKGEWLRQKTGDRNAGRILQACFLSGIIFGILLAVDIIRPVQW